MRILIGTSGYVYEWNKGIPSKFEWYIAQGFNSVEINASFYRFPNKSWVKSWKIASKDFRFSIKVHRSITHYAKLSSNALDTFFDFKNRLSEIDDIIRFWLFQMPPSYEYNEHHMDELKSFVTNANDKRLVFEFRDKSWWKSIDKINELGVIFCSVDAPNLPRDVIVSNNVIYLRLHGRDMWYSYQYSEFELEAIIKEIKQTNTQEVAIYLNNDQGMLSNARYLLERLL
ncbi:MAG: DUF72 domain-containing protein [Candidatus Nitrosocaldaceae archaeon]